MTKKIRLENADTSNHKVVIQVWQIQHGDIDDLLVQEINLNNPCDLVDVTIWKGGQYLKVVEI